MTPTGRLAKIRMARLYRNLPGYRQILMNSKKMRLGLRSAFRHSVRWALASAGLEVVSQTKYLACVEELYGCMRETYFPELCDQPGRSELLAKLLGTQVSEGLHIVASLQRSLQFPGQVCEFGVAQGATSALLANELMDHGRELWLFDSFQGLPKPSSKDILINDVLGLGSMDNYEGMMSCGKDQVLRRLKDVDFPPARTRIVPGFVELEQPPESMPTQVCFAYVDFDLYEPILAVLELLDQTMSAGGVVIVDDYGYFSAGAQAAVDEFMACHTLNWRMEVPPAFAGHFCTMERRPNAMSVDGGTNAVGRT